MSEKRLRLRTLSDFWTDDKALLIASGAPFEPAWESSVPTQSDLEAIAKAYIASHSDDSPDFVLTQNALQEVVARLSQEVSSLWQDRLTEIPQVSILSSADYQLEFNKLSKEMCDHLGIEVDDAQEPLCPPSVSLFPHEGRLLVSDVCSLPARSDNTYVVSHTPWKRNHLEYYLAQALATSLYAQIRGDWKNPDSISLNSLSCDSHYILSAMLLYGSETLARSSHPEWGLHAVYDKVFDFYANSDALPLYRFVDAYVRSVGKSLAQLAMISGFHFQPKEGSLEVLFTKKHPFHEMRVRYFKEGREAFS